MNMGRLDDEMRWLVYGSFKITNLVYFTGYRESFTDTL